VRKNLHKTSVNSPREESRSSVIKSENKIAHNSSVPDIKLPLITTNDNIAKLNKFDQQMEVDKRKKDYLLRSN